MIKKYFISYLNKHATNWVVFAIDMSIVACAFCLAYFIRFNLSINFDLNQLLYQLPIVLLGGSIGFLVFGSFKNTLNYTGFSDIINLFKSVTLMFTLLGLFIFINKNIDIIPDFTIPVSILITHSLLTFLLLGFSRVIYKYLNTNKLYSRKVLIYGIDDVGVMAYHAIMNNALEKFKVVGFINDGQLINKKFIDGVPIWPESKITKEFIKTHGIENILICSDHIDENSSFFKDLKIKTTKLLPLHSWVKGDLTLNKLKAVNIEALLERAPIKINNTNVVKEFTGETILITGAASAIGKELVHQIIGFDVKKIILIDQSELDLYDLQQDLKQKGKHNFVAIIADISDGLRIDMLFQEHKPTVVFHASEYTNEPLLEKSPYEAIKININGTKFLADTSSRYNVKKFVFVSNNKAINPNSSIGVTKRLAELYLTCLQTTSKTKFVTVRYSNLVDSKCSIVSRFEKQIRNGGPITIAHKDLTRHFTSVPEVVELILEAGTMGKGGEIFVFNTGQPIKIYELAKRMLHLLGFEYSKDINIKVTGLNAEENIQEEFMANIEIPVYTYHKKIMIFNTIELNYTKIKSGIEELCFNNRFQHTDIILKMKQLIPNSETSHSEYDPLYQKVQSYKKTTGMLPENTNQVNIN